MRPLDDGEVQGEINILPMIDVIFSILAFMIISSISLTRSEGLPVNLPSAKTAQTEPTQQINVTIQPDGNLYLNRQPIQLNNLKGEVGKLITSNQENLVIINADTQVDHGQVVEVMDNLRQVKGVRLAIATQKN
ncbi:Biopolymer transport protein ExbD/TolR [Gloeothece citriformis PCC 7424]|uniref:Biopolymer transport protein ExbD/TolR n=1 Tax=Gloeothece citriformis (strain PCC 7424) TaxID=65393 RepID=B7KIX7_GLOC7|nr:biopolymer transporter ExbD [Gloeothece citriformis]ACK70813.1 Biopolymer transport protein ExbD/TolR [Gloeothece citriformis PCC 7424]